MHTLHFAPTPTIPSRPTESEKCSVTVTHHFKIMQPCSGSCRYHEASVPAGLRQCHRWRCGPRSQWVGACLAETCSITGRISGICGRKFREPVSTAHVEWSVGRWFKTCCLIIVGCGATLKDVKELQLVLPPASNVPVSIISTPHSRTPSAVPFLAADSTFKPNLKSPLHVLHRRGLLRSLTKYCGRI